MCFVFKITAINHIFLPLSLLNSETAKKIPTMFPKRCRNRNTFRNSEAFPNFEISRTEVSPNWDILPRVENLKHSLKYKILEKDFNNSTLEPEVF